MATVSYDPSLAPLTGGEGGEGLPVSPEEGASSETAETTALYANQCFATLFATAGRPVLPSPMETFFATSSPPSSSARLSKESEGLSSLSQHTFSPLSGPSAVSFSGMSPFSSPAVFSMYLPQGSVCIAHTGLSIPIPPPVAVPSRGALPHLSTLPFSRGGERSLATSFSTGGRLEKNPSSLESHLVSSPTSSLPRHKEPTFFPGASFLPPKSEKDLSLPHTPWYEQRERREQGGQQQHQQPQEEASTTEEEEASLSSIETPGKAPSRSIEEEVLHRTLSLPTLQAHHFAVFLLICALMKLIIRAREQHAQARREQLEEVLYQIDKLSKTFKEQAEKKLSNALTTCGLAVAAAFTPLVRRVAGEELFKAFSSIFTSIKDMEPKEFMDMVEKMLTAGAQMNQDMGTMQDAHYQGHESFANHMAQLLEEKLQEISRTLNETRNDWDEALRFLAEFIRTYQNAAEALYR